MRLLLFEKVICDQLHMKTTICMYDNTKGYMDSEQTPGKGTSSCRQPWPVRQSSSKSRRKWYFLPCRHHSRSHSASQINNSILMILIYTLFNHTTRVTRETLIILLEGQVQLLDGRQVCSQEQLPKRAQKSAKIPIL